MNEKSNHLLIEQILNLRKKCAFLILNCVESRLDINRWFNCSRWVFSPKYISFLKIINNSVGSNIIVFKRINGQLNFSKKRWKLLLPIYILIPVDVLIILSFFSKYRDWNFYYWQWGLCCNWCKYYETYNIKTTACQWKGK